MIFKTFQAEGVFFENKSVHDYRRWGEVGKNRAASRENTPLGRSASSYARTAAVRYTRVSFLPQDQQRVRNSVRVLHTAVHVGVAR